MLDSYKKLHELLLPKEKRNFFFLVIVMLIEAGMEMLGVGIIPAFVTLIAFPEQVNSFQWLNTLAGDKLLLWMHGDRVIYWASAILLLFFVIKTGFSIASTYWKSTYAQNRSLRIGKRLYTAYMNAPYTFHLQNGTPDLIRNINNECTLLSVHVLIPMVDLISQGIILIGISLVLVISVPFAALFWLMVFLGLGISSAMLMDKKVRQLGVEAQEHRSLIIKTAKEGLEGVKEISILGRAVYFTTKLVAAFSRQLQIQRIIQVLQHALPSLIELVTIIGLLGVTVMLFAKGHDPEKVIPVLTIFTVALVRMKGSMRSIMQDYTNIRHAGVSLDLVYDELKKLDLNQKREEEIVGAEFNIKFDEKIEINDLWYKYPESDRYALENINLAIGKGEAIGFVGTTGAGKSTLVDVIMGVLQPYKGHVYADGRDIHNQLQKWQSNIGYIPQNIFLADGTITENIAFGIDARDIDSLSLEQAIHVSNLKALIEVLPDGVDTLVGEHGIRLSGGERQRIAIARAIYNNPDILVMDEATSALDNITEATVVQEVEELKGSRTILVIAHRLSTVRRCDRIVFLKNGKIDAIGSYSELIKSHPEFLEMTRVVE